MNGYLRPASPADAEQLAAVHVRSWQAAYRGLLPQDYLDGLDPADRVGRWQDILATLAGSHQGGGPGQGDKPRQGDGAGQGDGLLRGVVVAVADDTVCGFASLGPTRDQDGDPQRIGEVNAIYLMPEAWGQGLGRMLMAEAVSQLAACYEQATLWVLDSNDRARHFYARNGWAQDGAVKQDDSRGFPITEVRYRRSLP